MPKLPVVAAIANYNMAKELEHLLPQVVKQGYDDIFVLDDASTDNSREVVGRFRGVQFIAGKTNKGAGANRNRIIAALKYDALIHFLDADVDLETSNTAALVRKVAPDQPFGFVGGLIKNPSGLQNVWNYGTGVSLRSSVAAQMQTIIQPLIIKNPKRAKWLRRRLKNLLAGWPDPLAKPFRREVYWNAEANMVVRSDIFASFGGFNEKYRETEILDLATRMHNRGLPCYFDPLLSVQHKEGKVRLYNRDIVKAKEMLWVGHQFGWLRWLRSDGEVKHTGEHTPQTVKNS
jgi:N-acetylglucosaminyl-diphospho-decaprenol L-rhamnosyltransferase